MALTARTSMTAVAAVVAMLTLSAPAAHASAIYPPAGSCTATPATITPGGSVEFACQAETFSPSEDVTITVTGENGAATEIGMVRFAITTASGTVTSGDDGSLSAIPLTLPSNARGTYNIAAVSATSAGGTAAVTVSASEGALPITGLDGGTLAGLLIGGGALLLAGAAIAIVAVVRRRNDAR
jgi:hypothetical protein